MNKTTFIVLASTSLVLGGAYGCLGGKESEPRVPATPSSTPRPLQKSTEIPPRPRVGPTAELGRAVPTEFSPNVKSSLTEADLSIIKADMGVFFGLSRCASKSITITTPAEGQPNPGVIILDLEAIEETERAYGLTHGLLLRSTVLQALSYSCYDAEHFEEKTYDIGGGFRLKINPGLNLTFVQPNGAQNDSEILSRAISGALADFVTKQGFPAFSPEEANIVLLTSSLFDSKEDAQRLSEMMYQGDFSGFVSFVRGISPVQTKQEDMQAVLTWYARAQNAQSQADLDMVIKEMLDSRGKPLNVKTNFNLDQNSFPQVSKAEELFQKLTKRNSQSQTQLTAFSKEKSSRSRIIISPEVAMELSLVDYEALQAVFGAFRNYTNYVGDPLTSITIATDDHDNPNFLTYPDIENHTLVVFTKNMSHWATSEGRTFSQVLEEETLRAIPLITENKLSEEPLVFQVDQDIQAVQTQGFALRFEAKDENGVVKGTRDFYVAENIVSSFIGESVKEETTGENYLGINQDLQKTSQIIDFLVYEDIKNGKFSSKQEAIQTLARWMREGRLKDFVAWIRGVDKKSLSNNDCVIANYWLIKAGDFASDPKQFNELMAEVLKMRGKPLDQKTNFKTNPLDDPRLVLFDLIAQNKPAGLIPRLELSVRRSNLLIRILKESWHKTNDGRIRKEIVRLQAKIRKDKEKVRRERNKNKQVAVLERTEAFARQGAVV